MATAYTRVFFHTIRCCVFACTSLTLLTSCGGDDEEDHQPDICGDLGDPGFYDINGLQGSVFVTTTEIWHSDFDNSDNIRRKIDSEYEEDDLRRFDEIAIQLIFEVQRYYADLPWIPFVSRAHACSPALPEFTENITAISVTSTATYNDVAIGESLNEIMDVVDEGYDFYDRYYPHPASVAAFMANGDQEVWGAIMLELGTAPEQSGEHIFTIQITLDNGETYSYETPAITLAAAE